MCNIKIVANVLVIMGSLIVDLCSKKAHKLNVMVIAKEAIKLISSEC